jgi:hypothetical protein
VGREGLQGGNEEMKLTAIERAAVGLAGLLVLLSLALPLWTMLMQAIFYPGGLWLHIYANRVTGDIQEISSLNHYIGMRPINQADFPEFQYLPLAIGAVGALVLLTALVGRRWTVWIATGSLTTLGLGALYVLIRRLWEYGHDLSPTAAIKIQPFMPPVVGYQVQIANFKLTTFFDLGGLSLIVAELLLLAVAFGVCRRISVRAEARPPEKVNVAA